MSDLYAEAFGRQRFVLTLMVVSPFIALALTVAGIFGVLSQIVFRRTREIGIRVVLGAQPRDVMGQVLRSGLMLSLAGAAIGIGAALSLARVLRTLLFGVTPVRSRELRGRGRLPGGGRARRVLAARARGDADRAAAALRVE